MELIAHGNLIWQKKDTKGMRTIKSLEKLAYRLQKNNLKLFSTSPNLCLRIGALNNPFAKKQFSSLIGRSYGNPKSDFNF